MQSGAAIRAQTINGEMFCDRRQKASSSLLMQSNTGICPTVALAMHHWRKRYSILGLLLHYRDRFGQPIFPKGTLFGELRVDWECYCKYDGKEYPRDDLKKFSEWPAIEELSCRLFDHPHFAPTPGTAWNRGC